MYSRQVLPLANLVVNVPVEAITGPMTDLYHKKDEKSIRMVKIIRFVIINVIYATIGG